MRYYFALTYEPPRRICVRRVFDNIVRHRQAKSAGRKPGCAVNQRVKSAIEVAQKIDTGLRAFRGEKAASTVRSPLGRIALCPVFATKVPKGGGVPEKVY